MGENRHKKLDREKIGGELAARVNARGGRRLLLSQEDRKKIAAARLIERMVELFLDMEQARTRRQIAEELGISASKLSDLSMSEEFQERYSARMLELRHDPRVMASQAAISDLLPLSVKVLQELLVSPTASDASRLAAAKEVLRLGGVQENRPARADKSELQEFLRGQGVSIQAVSVSVPGEYLGGNSRLQPQLLRHLGYQLKRLSR